MQVIHPFDARADGELSLSVGDYVIVRQVRHCTAYITTRLLSVARCFFTISTGLCCKQVAPTGWSEGECNRDAGWFPSAYVERRRTLPSSKVADNASRSDPSDTL